MVTESPGHRAVIVAHACDVDAHAEVDTYTPVLTAADATQIYTTVKGDTLGVIAQRFGFSAEDAELIAAHNAWTGVGDVIEPGTVVMIPPPNQPAG